MSLHFILGKHKSAHKMSSESRMSRGRSEWVWITNLGPVPFSRAGAETQLFSSRKSKVNSSWKAQLVISFAAKRSCVSYGVELWWLRVLIRWGHWPHSQQRAREWGAEGRWWWLSSLCSFQSHFRKGGWGNSWVYQQGTWETGTGWCVFQICSQVCWERKKEMHRGRHVTKKCHLALHGVWIIALFTQECSIYFTWGMEVSELLLVTTHISKPS